MIIVLTLGRSGSSLLMQTLHKLGIAVVGRRFDVKADPESQHFHEMLNPKGYYENPDIYYGGPSSNAFQTLMRDGARETACKMDLRHFVDEAQWPYWLDAAASISSILISYRSPSEQARSECAALAESLESRDHTREFTFITQFLKDYVATYGAVGPLLNGKLQPLTSKMDYMAYCEAVDPGAYTRKICAIAGLRPSPQQLSSAVSNISPQLWRIRDCDLTPEERGWASQLGASQVHSQLERKRILKLATLSGGSLAKNAEIAQSS